MTRPQYNEIYGDRVRPRVEWDEDAVGAHQSFKDEVDINNIVARYVQTGVAPEIGTQQQYVDTLGILDFAALQNALADISSEFERLPVRERESFSSALEWFEATHVPVDERSDDTEALRPSDSDDSGQAEPPSEAHGEESP